MQWIIVFACVCAIVALFVITARNASELAELRDLLVRLRREIDALKRDHGTTTAATAAPEMAPPTITQETQPSSAAPIAPMPPAACVPPAGPAPQPAFAADPQGVLERQFGGRAFVWIGGIALALAGFYLVKYSIDTGLLTETVRVALGVCFGLALLAGGQFVRSKTHIADGTRIAQALAGAGIADLYGSLFAATTLYHLIPSWLGFAAMAAVTATALVLSLRHGSPIAALGLVGGYATPAMIQGEPNAPLLFAYLYIVFAGLSALARGRHWWWLPFPAVGVAFLWVIAWLLMGHGSDDATWLSLFLLAVAVTAALSLKQAPPADPASPQYWLRNLAPIGSILLMGAVTYNAQFSDFEWAMFASLSVGALLLAWFDNATYRFVPWLAMAANLVMLLGWQGSDPGHFAIVLTAFALLFGAGSRLLMPRSGHPVSWAGLSAATSLCYFLLAYTRLDHSLVAALGSGSAKLAWGTIAVAAAALFAIALTQMYVRNTEIRVRHTLQAIYAVAAVALLSVGFAILLDQEYLPFAAAAQVFALAWIATRVDIPALRIIAQVLTGIFALLLYPELFRLLGWIATDEPLGALFRFGLPAALFAGASRNWREQSDDRFVQVLEFASVLLVGCLCYRIVDTVFVGHASSFELVTSAVFTSILLLLALFALRLARQHERIAVFWAGVSLGALALLRIAGLSLVVFNPLWSHQWVGTWPLLNALLLAYAVPAALCVFIGREVARADQRNAAFVAHIAAYVLGAVTVSLWVRQIFEGAYLDAATAGNAEVYAYSAAWLVSGVVLLLVAVLRNDPMMRVASLIVMLLTVGKVFLFDASQLTGLWRVVSFLMLGFSLLGISWLYSRFVFASRDPTR